MIPIRHTDYKNRNATAGIALLLIGGILLANSLGASLPAWLFSWPMLLIVTGLITGIRHRFTRRGAFLMIITGMFFLREKFSLSAQFAILWPILVIGLGICIIIQPINHISAGRAGDLTKHGYINRA